MRTSYFRLLAVLIGVAVVSGSAAHAGDRVKLKMQSAWRSSLPALGSAAMHFSETVDEASGGELRFKFFEPKKLVPALQIFDAVAAGTIDSGYSWPGYWMGKMPALAVFAAVPFGPESPEFLAWIHHGGGLEIWRELYARQGVVPVPCGVLPPESSGWFAKPIETVADLKGLKIRYSGLGGEVMRKLGASITLLSADDIFPNLERGVIDGTEFSLPAIDEVLGFHKVVKNNYFPGWHQPSSVLELIVNQEVWQGLTSQQRAFIEMACGNTVLWGLTTGQTMQGPSVRRFRDSGVNIRTWSPELLAAFRAAAKEVLDEHSERDADFWMARESLESFMAEHAEWRGLAYLP